MTHLLLVSLPIFLLYGRVTPQDPHNTAAIVGDDVILSCTVPTIFNFVIWEEYAYSNIGNTIFSNGVKVYEGSASVGARYSLNIDDSDVANDVINLVISDVILSDGGRYSCQNVVSSSVHSAELIIIDKFSCSWTHQDNTITDLYVVSGDVLDVTCTFMYHGTWSPVVTCAGTEVYGWTSDVTTSGDDVTHVSTGTVGPQQISSNITCTAFFDQPVTAITDRAANVPDFKTSWTSGSIPKHYPATSIQLSPLKTSYDVGDVITCTASGGYPSPSYKWTNVGTSAQLSGVNTLTVGMILDNVNIRCTATTDVHGGHVLSTDRVVQVTPPDTPWTSWAGSCPICGSCRIQTRSRTFNSATVQQNKWCPPKRCNRSWRQRGEILRSKRGRLIRRDRRCCYSWKRDPNYPGSLPWRKLCLNVNGFI